MEQKVHFAKIMAGLEIPDEGQVIKAANMMFIICHRILFLMKKTRCLKVFQNMIHHHANEDELVKAKAMMTRLGITDFEAENFRTFRWTEKETGVGFCIDYTL